MAYIWKDQFDPNNFHLAVKTNKGYAIWVTIFIDAISDLFSSDDTESYEWVRNLAPGIPTEIKLTMHLK